MTHKKVVGMRFKSIGSRGFLNLPDHNDFESSKVVVVPFGLEKSVTYARGTAKGPQAIINASHEVELFDQQLGCEPYTEFGVATMLDPQIPASQKRALEMLAGITVFLLKQNKFPVILGGEHSVLGGSAQGIHQALGKINMLHFDAHSDLRPSFEGNPLSHASAMHIALPYVGKIVQIGIRNTSFDEVPVIEKLKKEGRLKTFTSEEIVYEKKNYLPEVIELLSDAPVYLTFDIDAFDPSVIGSSTGTPEPGGLSWYDIIVALREATKKLNIIGAEFVELLPRKENPAADFAIAKLIYAFLVMRFTKK